MFQIAIGLYSGSLTAHRCYFSIFKLGDECELWEDDLFKRAVEKLEKIKRMTSETYDEIACVTNAAWKEQDDE